MVGPRYQEPDTLMPTAFQESKEADGSYGNLCGWWSQFNDPVLDSLISEALDANYDLRLAIERIEQTRSQYRIEKSYLWPEIDLNATATRTRISQNLFNQPPQAAAAGISIFPKFLNIFQVGLDAIWELDLWGRIRHNKRAAYYTFEASIEDSENVLISMVSEVAVNYINIRALQQRIDLAKKKIEADSQELEIMRHLFQIGLDNEMQVTNQISLLEADRAALPVLETSLKQTIYALAVLLGRQPEGLSEIFQETAPIPTASNRVPVGLPSDLLRRRPDVRSAERQLAAATEQIGAAMAEYFPHIALTGLSFGAGNKAGSSFGFESNKSNNLLEAASRMFSVGLGLNWNLVNFGRVRAQVDVQKSLQRQALLSYEQTVISSLKDVESALAAYFEEQNRNGSLLQKLQADQRTAEIMENLNRVGLANELQLLQTQKNLIDSESYFVESQQALAGDLIALYKAIGGDWNCDSAEPSEEHPCD